MAECKVCGLRADQLPPIWRFVKAEDSTALASCAHPFGIPAVNVPDWRTEPFKRTHNSDGTPINPHGLTDYIARLDQLGE